VDLTPGVVSGETLGAITYSAGGATLATIPAVALQDSPAASYMTKLKRRLNKIL
jgi:D-alanyl-D-alanine carboxypeptidase (penicillin-binding protein 5/6)